MGDQARQGVERIGMGSRVKDFDFKQRTLESDEESVAVAWAENHGWIVRKMQYIGRRGCADRFFFGYGQVVMIEFKRLSDGVKSGNQDAEHKRLAAVGCPVFVFYTSDSAINLLKTFM